MGLFGQSRAWRAVMLACGLAWLGSLSGLKAETLASAPDMPATSAEPFALAATPLAAGSLHDKWLGLQRRLDDDPGGDAHRPVTRGGQQDLASGGLRRVGCAGDTEGSFGVPFSFQDG